LITSTSLDLVGHVNKLVELVFDPHVSSYVLVKSIHVRPIKVVTPPNTFKQHLPKMFFQHKVGEMEIDETPV
jgi:hypothetical protein